MDTFAKLIFDILFYSKLVQTLIEVGLTKELEFEIGKTLNGKNLKNMALITVVFDPLAILDRKTVASRRILIDDYQTFTKEDPIELLESYIADCLSIGLTPVAYSHYELPKSAHDVYSLRRKRRSKSTGDGPSGIAKPLTKISRTSDILRNIMGPEAKTIGSGSPRSVEVSVDKPHGKSPLAETPFNFVCSVIYT